MLIATRGAADPLVPLAGPSCGSSVWILGDSHRCRSQGGSLGRSPWVVLRRFITSAVSADYGFCGGAVSPVLLGRGWSCPGRAPDRIGKDKSLPDGCLRPVGRGKFVLIGDSDFTIAQHVSGIQQQGADRRPRLINQAFFGDGSSRGWLPGQIGCRRRLSGAPRPRPEKPPWRNGFSLSPRTFRFLRTCKGRADGRRSNLLPTGESERCFAINRWKPIWPIGASGNS